MAKPLRVLNYFARPTNIEMEPLVMMLLPKCWLLLFLVLVLPVTIGKLGLLKAQFINSSIKAKEEGKEKEKDDGNVFCFRGSDEAEGYEGVGTGEKVKEAVVKKLGKSKTVDRGGSLSLVS
ncbi:uncharacterized protein LOC132313271 isoform X3 [Cornus florida]|uniref:uncharacterized protein LOC132313271 isoform X3 n=1 Tax=Cornus florida TaxID=4283 RepID=UPI00289CB7C1|nr:uncharacterized protein LOC132313271 isoform X3 [Cornus florida]XP_059667950.1 uncharacterized protein LOC132313271 isoform X3 [Cornus florida]XP_059667951.1 uncharacterized protein LOC132313271 isoform X3 [Cornus florida]XP_059667952.1 uncharacterized protein LOC132313271 isoform X3 [Cornus florida]